MHVIWLIGNVLWEIALNNLAFVAVGLLLWIALMIAALSKRRAQWGLALKPALLLGLFVALIALVLLPGWSRSSFSEVAYWVDWAYLVFMALGIGGIAAAFFWPWRARRSAR